MKTLLESYYSSRKGSMESTHAIGQPRKNHYVWLSLLVLMSTATFARLAMINRPFAADSESTACGFAVPIARNYVRYGPVASRFAGVMNVDQVARDNWVIYAHHPPLVPLLVAAVQSVAGVFEWTARMIPSLFSLTSTALLFAMAQWRFGLLVAFIAGILYAFCPMTIVFGGMPEYINGQLVFFALATVESYARWDQTHSPRWIVALVIFFILGALSDWPIFYLVPVLSTHYLLSRSSRSRALLCLFPFWAARVIFHHQGMLHTWPVLFLVGMYVVITSRRIIARDWIALRPHLVPLLLLGWGALHLFVGIQGNYWQEWWSVILTPGLAFAAALGIEVVIDFLPYVLRRPGPITVLLAVAVMVFIASSFQVAKSFSEEWITQGWVPVQDYTLKELGTTIQSISGVGEGILTSDTTHEPALWFYADRQIRPGITSSEKLNQSLSAGPYPLYYEYLQPKGPSPRWFVMPASHQIQFQPLAAELDARFPHHLVNGFMVYQFY